MFITATETQQFFSIVQNGCVHKSRSSRSNLFLARTVFSRGRSIFVDFMSYAFYVISDPHMCMFLFHIYDIKGGKDRKCRGVLIVSLKYLSRELNYNSPPPVLFTYLTVLDSSILYAFFSIPSCGTHV